MEIGAATVENSMKVPQKLKIELSYYPVIPLLAIYPKKIQKDKCTPMFTKVLFMIAKIIEATQASTDRWIDKDAVYIDIHIHTYNGYKKEWNPAICNTKDGPRGYNVSEISHSEKVKYHMISLMCGI